MNNAWCDPKKWLSVDHVDFSVDQSLDFRGLLTLHESVANPGVSG